MTSPPRSAARPDPARLRRGRAITSLVVVVLLAFSPSVAYYVSRAYDDWAGRRTTPPVVSEPLPRPPETSSRMIASYAPLVAPYEAVLSGLQVSELRRVRLLSQHFELYRLARPLIGEAQAASLLRLITLETRNQDPALGRRSVYSSPEAALDSARRWLGFMYAALRGPARLDPAALDRLVRERAPVPMVPGLVLAQAQWLRRAAAATHLSPAVLAAIVDNEQAGSHQAYGLAGALRGFTDNAALRAAEMYGSSGLSGRLSQTVGLAQMSWQDALVQGRRLSDLQAPLGLPYPQTEAEARALLARPYANLLFTASRLRGYLNHTQNRAPDDAAPLTDAWTYFLAPGWHNNPALASSGQTWPYAWNAFFKACLYDRWLR